MKIIHIQLPDGQYNTLKELKTARDFVNISETVRFLISEAKDRYLNNYRVLQAKRLELTKASPEERAAHRKAVSEATQALEAADALEAARNICAALGGTEFDLNGVPHCRYTTYTQMTPHTVEATPTEIGLGELTEAHIRLQYRDLLGGDGPDAKIKLTKLLKKYAKETN